MSLRARFTKFRRRMKADGSKGSAAIEFAMVAPVFFILIMGTIEAGVMFFAQSVLQNGLNETARMVRTGQSACYSTSGGNCVAMTQAQFRTTLCTYVSALLTDCAGSSLQFDVQPYPTGFGSAANSSPLDSGQNLPGLTKFDAGKACQVVLVRAFYKWPIFTPIIGNLMRNMTGDFHLISSAAAFRNEPYDNNAAGC